MPKNWPINQSAPCCWECEHNLQPGQAYFSGLVEADGNAEEAFQRRDYCLQCWESVDEGNFFSYWKTRRPPEDKKPRVNTAVVFDFFDKLRDSDRADATQMRFVLALYLARRKELDFVNVKNNGRNDVLLFRRKASDETLQVEDPDLSDAEIETATEQLKALFPQEM